MPDSSDRFAPSGAASLCARPQTPAPESENRPRGRDRDRQPAPIVPKTAPRALSPRVPRSSSTKSLPRGRSLQGRPQTPAEAQEGYRARMAAKQYAAKKKARDAQTDVINITVDDKGVKIDKDGSAPGPVLTAQGMGPRRGSRSRVGRSGSRVRNGSAGREDKENMSAGNQKTDAAQVDAFFNRKRGTVTADPRSPKEAQVDVVPSWDGSMPRRHSSRSFIQQRASVNGKGNGQEKSRNSFAVLAATDENGADGQRGVREQDRPRRQRSPGAGVKKREGQVLKVQEVVRRDVALKSGSASTLEEVLKDTLDSRSGGDSMSPTTSVISAEVNIPDMDVTGGYGNAKGGEDVDVDAADSEEGKAEVDCSGGKARKSAWCEECSGVGADIAALIVELEKHRTMAENRSEPVTAGGVMRGWKTYVAQTMLGESKSKGCADKARLQQEVNVLQATVEFLHKKIESIGEEGSE